MRACFGGMPLLLLCEMLGLVDGSMPGQCLARPCWCSSLLTGPSTTNLWINNCGSARLLVLRAAAITAATWSHVVMTEPAPKHEGSTDNGVCQRRHALLVPSSSVCKFLNNMSECTAASCPHECTRPTSWQLQGYPVSKHGLSLEQM